MSTGTCTGLIGLAGGSCTIVNTQQSQPFAVAKVYSDGTTTAVPVSVLVHAGTVSGSPTTAAPGNPAERRRHRLQLCNDVHGEGDDHPVRLHGEWQSGGDLQRHTRRGRVHHHQHPQHRAVHGVEGLLRRQHELRVGQRVVRVRKRGRRVEERAGGGSASFTVNKFTSNSTNCTATESGAPAGYTSSASCSASIAAGGCTITNTLIPPPPPPPPPPPRPRHLRHRPPSRRS